MQTDKAKQILKCLIGGVDPETQQELPRDAVLNRPDVIRALLLGVHVLEGAAARESRRSSLPGRIGKTWTQEEKSKLIEEFHSGIPFAEIAAAHGRTLRAIESRLEVMGLITAAERTTADRGKS